MRYHLIGLHHTQCNDAYSACAFTGKIRRLPAVIDVADPEAHVTLYGVGDWADHHMPDAGNCSYVRVRTNTDFRKRFGKTPWVDYAANCGNQESIADYQARLMTALARRVKKDDFILHPFGSIHSALVQALPQAIHVESGIGYMSGPFGAYRIFETEAWRHWHFGRFHDYPMRYAYSGGPQAYENTFVAPNYYDPKDWPLGDGSGDYVLFAGRLVGYKGLAIVAECARRLPGTKFVVAGSGPDGHTFFSDLPNVEMVGVVMGRARAKLYGEARCVIMPTAYVEPFGGVAVEAMLCGTPVVSSSFGCFTETVGQAPAAMGALCRTVGDFEFQLQDMQGLNHDDRRHMQQYAQRRWSYAAVAQKYAEAFQALRVRP